jgi:hypothetical protein
MEASQETGAATCNPDTNREVREGETKANVAQNEATGDTKHTHTHMRTKRRDERMPRSRKVQYEVADFHPKLHNQKHVIALLIAIQTHQYKHAAYYSHTMQLTLENNENNSP